VFADSETWTVCQESRFDKPEYTFHRGTRSGWQRRVIEYSSMNTAGRQAHCAEFATEAT